MMLMCALAERDVTAANRALTKSGERPWGFDAMSVLHSFGEGLIARMTNDSAKANSAFLRARAEQEKIVQSQPNYGPALCVLGLIDAGLGRKEEALREGRHAMELMPAEKEQVNGAHIIRALRSHCRVGRRKGFGLRTACACFAISHRARLRPTQTATLLGPPSR